MTKLEIIVTTQIDNETPRDDYDEYIGYRQKYIDRGFTEQQAKHFNRTYEPMIEKLGNGNYGCYGIIVKTNVTMPCGHIEEFNDSLWGSYADDWNDIMETVKYYGMIETVLDEVKQKGIDVTEYEIKEERD